MAKFCANCGSQMDDDDKACGQCGTLVVGAAVLPAQTRENTDINSENKKHKSP